MKDFKNYILVGIITAIIIYGLSPYLFGNRVEIVQAPISPVKNNKENVPRTCLVPSIPRLTEPLYRPFIPSLNRPSRGHSANKQRLIAVALRNVRPEFKF